jgi:hypothetical protein
MHTNTLRQAMQNQTFRPFSLRLADGRTLQVPHPDYIAVSTRHVIVIDPQDESVAWVEPLLIVSIDFAGSSSTTGNGQGTG